MIIFRLLQLSLAICGLASTPPRTGNGRGLLSYPIAHRKTHTPLNGRDISVAIHNQSAVSYLIERTATRQAASQPFCLPCGTVLALTTFSAVDIGTPAQRVDVALDTGSFELWVNPTCSTAGSDENIARCKATGRYNSKYSSSAVHWKGKNQIPYGKGGVTIGYVSDNIELDGSGREYPGSVSSPSPVRLLNHPQRPRALRMSYLALASKASIFHTA